MSLNGILSLISGHPEYRRHLEMLDSSGRPSQITVRQGGRAGYVAALWLQRKAPLLVLTPRPEDARRLHEQLLAYLGEEQAVYLLPEPEVLPFERLAVDAYTGNQRLAALAALAEAGGPYRWNRRYRPLGCRRHWRGSAQDPITGDCSGQRTRPRPTRPISGVSGREA